MYVGLTFLIPPKTTLLIQLFMPLVMLVTYLFILGKPGKILPSEKDNNTTSDTSSIQAQDPLSHNDGDLATDDSKPLLGETVDEDGYAVDAGMDSKPSRLKLRLFNREEAGVLVAMYVVGGLYAAAPLLW